jgi:NADH-quinone oxidoreductase subunit M
MGPVKDPLFDVLTDAAWYERLSSILLVAGIVVIGVAPFWLNDLLKPGIDAFMDHAGQTGFHAMQTGLHTTQTGFIK